MELPPELVIFDLFDVEWSLVEEPTPLLKMLVVGVHYSLHVGCYLEVPSF